MTTSPNPDDAPQPESDVRSFRGVVRGKFAAKGRERLPWNADSTSLGTRETEFRGSGSQTEFGEPE